MEFLSPFKFTSYSIRVSFRQRCQSFPATSTATGKSQATLASHNGSFPLTLSKTTFCMHVYCRKHHFQSRLSQLCMRAKDCFLRIRACRRLLFCRKPHVFVEKCKLMSKTVCAPRATLTVWNRYGNSLNKTQSVCLHSTGESLQAHSSHLVFRCFLEIGSR